MSFPDRLQLGDSAPFTYGVSGKKAFWSFDAQAGRPSLVVVVASLGPAAAQPLFDALQQAQSALAELDADAYALIDAESPYARGYIDAPPCGVETMFCAPDVIAAWRFSGAAPLIYALDRAARMIDRRSGETPAQAVQDALASLADESREAPQHPLLPAPVLITPHVFSKPFCRELIEYFESSAHEPGGMASVDAAGQPYHKIDEAKKKRRDLLLAPEDPFNRRILADISRVCAPEVKKAFQFEATHIDRILIARYDDDGGRFRRHRDNADGSVAFRHFALSIPLNENYDGGELTFPEYNDHLYKPRAGCGIVFSASLLHEVRDVSKGSRYVVLTFLHKSV